ncbi:asparagine synthase (glutamine-hydrolyzing) [Flavobacterium sp. CYK-55]|uniref:asparagine synthase (glutamine-hydrolyzing) n=1 Tax=Flavobacterium sp. CYK-55 TaxID=2835529 RepID=UPI001BCFB2D3|nr:asparagine synthase (glutamine-hydrolyzing) [Flavobacterium sp. CYK-55]MBS7788236.1 asparagine synthase (glutamine-hydrolyzing) [Flavobacterium sp. CYK-55]
MCGINGIFHIRTPKEVDAHTLIKMRDVLEHRGPDDNGMFTDKNLGLGHRRLSIIDVTAAGHQPFISPEGRYVMVFNGEIYNYRDFYAELKNSGYNIQTQSDTEVLLALYQIHGLKMLSKLNGMFAFAIWDKVERTLTVARDRMGVKPLYYSWHEGSFYFASEQKALFAAGVPLRISQSGIEEYIFNRFVAGQDTLFENVQKLLPGHSMVISEDGQVKTHTWWNLKTEIQQQATIQKPLDWFRETFDSSVKLRMVSDVPVGVLLSAGLDSSSILASMHHQKFSDIQTYTIGFQEAEHNEAHLAEMLTHKFNYRFNKLELRDEQVYQQLLSATYYQDEPLMHLSEPHLLALSKLAQPNVKVLLSGEGGDELMGGYVRYKPLQFPSLLQAAAVINKLDIFSKKMRYDKLARYASIDNSRDLVLYNGSNIYPKDIAQNFGIHKTPENQYRNEIYRQAQELYPNNLRRQALYFDQHTYLCSLLDRNDRCTMGASIECREPFLDQRLLTGLGSLDDQWLFTGKKGKYILKTSMQQRLPDDILKFRKVGLSTPWGEYLTQNPAFSDEMSSFTNSEIFKWSYFENIKIDKMIAQLRAGDKRMVSYIVPLFMLHIWVKYYVEKFSALAEIV